MINNCLTLKGTMKLRANSCHTVNEPFVNALGYLWSQPKSIDGNHTSPSKIKNKTQKVLSVLVVGGLPLLHKWKTMILWNIQLTSVGAPAELDSWGELRECSFCPWKSSQSQIRGEKNITWKRSREQKRRFVGKWNTAVGDLRVDHGGVTGSWNPRSSFLP